MGDARLGQWLNLLLCSIILLKSTVAPVEITILQTAVSEGAVCLDGSPPAYHLDKGFGSGVNNWLVHIEGGGWCNNVTNCLGRKSTRLGSSKQMLTEIPFSGILSNRESLNPDFYNWNRIKVRYCDGSSFTGDVEEVDPATGLYFRGARIFRAVIADLLAKGMAKAENAVLSGCSAGGLTSILHCDNFRALLPARTTVKCVSDAGYFINIKDISGAQHIQEYYNDVVTTHGSAKNLPPSCTSELRPDLCFFPQYVAPHIQTPIFYVNAAYDSWQIKNILAPGVADPHGTWRNCKLDIRNCSTTQLKTIQYFRLQFLSAIGGVSSSPLNGMFIDSCYLHCQTEMQETWLMPDSPLLSKTTIAGAVGDWFYDRIPFQKTDCPYPCNPTCYSPMSGPNSPMSEPNVIDQNKENSPLHKNLCAGCDSSLFMEWLECTRTGMYLGRCYGQLCYRSKQATQSLKLRTSYHCFSELSDRFHGFPPICPKEMRSDRTVMIGHLLPWTR